MRRIKVTLSADGTQHIEVLGAAGSGCLDLTRALEQRLGKPAGERTLKPEHATEDSQEADPVREQEPDA